MHALDIGVVSYGVLREMLNRSARPQCKVIRRIDVLPVHAQQLSKPWPIHMRKFRGEYLKGDTLVAYRSIHVRGGHYA